MYIRCSRQLHRQHGPKDHAGHVCAERNGSSSCCKQCHAFRGNFTPYLDNWPSLHESVGGLKRKHSHNNSCSIPYKFDKPVMYWQVFALKVCSPGCLFIKKSKPNRLCIILVSLNMLQQADALKVCPIPDACLLVMAQRPSRLLGLPETRSLIFLIKNSPDQVEGYLDYLQPMCRRF